MDIVFVGIPPSLGQKEGGLRALKLAAYLSDALAREVEVRISPDYQSLERDLLSGSVVAAWGPPFVCARTEAYGGRGLVRGIRRGAATYRAALFSKKGSKVSLDSPHGLRAAWVDRDSVGGYLLPQAYLKSRGVHGWQSFREERFLGSYKAVLEAVLEGRSDLTAAWASPASATRSHTAADELLGPRSRELEILGHTSECPNDGVVLSPRAPEPLAAGLERAFLTLADTPEGPAILDEVFAVERFETAPRGSYRALYDLVFQALPG